MIEKEKIVMTLPFLSDITYIDVYKQKREIIYNCLIFFLTGIKFQIKIYYA